MCAVCESELGWKLKKKHFAWLVCLSVLRWSLLLSDAGAFCLHYRVSWIKGPCYTVLPSVFSIKNAKLSEVLIKFTVWSQWILLKMWLVRDVLFLSLFLSGKLCILAIFSLRTAIRRTLIMYLLGMHDLPCSRDFEVYKCWIQIRRELLRFRLMYNNKQRGITYSLYGILKYLKVLTMIIFYLLLSYIYHETIKF